MPTWEEAIQKLRGELIAQNNIDPAHIRDIRPLCRLSDHEALITKKLDTHVAIQLSLSDDITAARIIRDGVVAHSEYCRASSYRPRTRAAAAPRSPTLTVS
ncbi:hypothetical protein EXIGLDRAFT_779823 [Exidia glandulosa HHB12029]|uniref:Uncharacterized protein n=1 Tax=Exidia glandulosa HHB12029 TaxID=1314781 RepID=A0A165BWE0_EXIGL|nr:hypothetical protein EXIGLDRAFT_779823 [Exidia glandulosa HHB12029]